MTTSPVILKACVPHDDELARAAFESREYRPMVAAAFLDADGHVLLVRAGRSVKEWTLVEGEIDEREAVAAATSRAIRTCIDVSPKLLRPRDIGRVCDVDFSLPKAIPPGYTKGKRYFGKIIDYVGPRKVEALPSLAVAYIWCPLGDLERRLVNSSAWRRKLIFDILGFPH